MWHGLTVKQLGFLPHGKKLNRSHLKKKSLLVHKIKINEMFNECFCLCKLEV